MKQLKFGFVVLTVLMLVLSVGISVGAANVVSGDVSEMVLDVMFVIDGSGSMPGNDPNRLAREACKMFVDTCYWEETRAGYVVFDDVISKKQPLTEMKEEKNRNDLKTALDSIEYTTNGNTDIALGLSEAIEEFVDKDTFTKNRTPIIILLSDGEIDVKVSSRVNVHEQELKDNKVYCGNNEIPVYTIALGNFDKSELKSIAEETNGLFFEAQKAEDLSGVLHQILAHQLRTDINVLDQFESNGQSHTVTIPIPHDGIKQANITIQTKLGQGVKDIHLYNPGKSEIMMTPPKVLTTNSKYYQMIKITYPERGDWELSVTGVDKDQITISLLNNYDVQFQLKSNKTEIPNGGAATFEVYSSNGDDEELFDGAEGDITVTHVETGVSNNYLLDKQMTKSVTFNKAGVYEIVGHVVGKDQSFDRTAAKITVEVTPVPLTYVNNQYKSSATLFSPFLGMKVMNKKEFPIDRFISKDGDAKLDVTPVPGGWEEKINFAYDDATGNAVVSAMKSGTSDLKLKINDSFGQEIEYTLTVKVIPGFLPILLVIVFAGVVVGIVLLIRKIMQPRLKNTLTVSLQLPPELYGMTPPEAQINLAELNKKGKVSLRKILSSNLVISSQYEQVLSGISDFVDKLEFEAANKDVSSLKVYFPADKTANVLFNGAPITKKCMKTMTNNSNAIVTYNKMGSEYQMTFRLELQDFAGIGYGNDNPMGGNAFGNNGFDSNSGDGFGGFGGNDNSGFGGFGGNDNSGFGGFGGNDNNNGGFGSF